MVISQSGRTKIFIDCGIILAFRREVGFDMCFAGRIAFFLGNPHFQKIILQVQCSCNVGKLCGWTLDLIMIGRAGPLNVEVAHLIANLGAIGKTWPMELTPIRCVVPATSFPTRGLGGMQKR